MTSPLSVASLTAGEPFWLVAEMTSTPPYPLLIESMDLTVTGATEQKSCYSSMTSSSTVMESGQRYSMWYSMVPTATGESVYLGTFSLRWKRKVDHEGDGNNGLVLIQEKIPPVQVIRSPFVATLAVPPEGEVGALMACTLEVKNLSALPQFVILNVRSNPNDGGTKPFYFHAGELETTFVIQPHSSQVVQHLLLPMRSGFVSLPHFMLLSKRYDSEITLSQALQRVFIWPTKSLSLPLLSSPFDTSYG